MLQDVISLLSSDDDEAPADASQAAAVPAPAAKKKRKGRRQARGSWAPGKGRVVTSEPQRSEDSDTPEVRALQAMGATTLRSRLREQGLPAARTKDAMAQRLYRAERAAAAAEMAFGRDTAAIPPRFDQERAGRLGGVALQSCRLCAGDIAPPRRTFCCDECVHYHMLRTSGSYVRKATLRRDCGVCALCGADAHAAFLSAQRAVRAAGPAAAAAALAASVAGSAFERHARLSRGRRGRPSAGSFWQVDHIVAVADGGGSCSLSNLRTLCAACHAGVTAAQAHARAAARRELGVSRGASLGGSARLAGGGEGGCADELGNKGGGGGRGDGRGGGGGGGRDGEATGGGGRGRGACWCSDESRSDEDGEVDSQCPWPSFEEQEDCSDHDSDPDLGSGSGSLSAEVID